MTDLRVNKPKFFTTAKKGENYELRADLNSEYRDRRKDAIKKVIANMTVGKDVSGLFPEVLKNMQTEDLEQKKLVYLYLMNYAKTQPELVILAVNTFVKDTDDSNPLIRALAIRTMGCIRVEKIIDYLCEPLRKCLKDDDPYVRKTASICVAKLYDLNPELAIENGFVSLLQDMVSDSNPMVKMDNDVVANAITALAEINEASTTKDLFIINTSTLTKLLAALNVCTEWGRIAILTALADFKPADSKEAEHIVERVIPQFQHANASVVLSAIKMAPPLVTLLSSAPEVQYVALRNINLILQKQPDILQNEIRVFFCKYNDPPYIKLEKLEIMIKLASEKNVDQLLSELKEYASEVDVDIVRKSVRVIGQCAIKIDETSERCVNVLLDLINTRVNYVVQEAIVVIKDIFRKYPHKYEGIIPTLCENLDALDEPEAKASLIWIIGEYAEKIENAHDLILTFLDTFRDESSQVQLQLVTATIKLFLKKPQTTPDTAVVLSDKPTISVQSNSMSGPLLEELINNISTLASVYHKPPETFIGKGRFGADAVQKKAIEEQEEASNESSIRMQVKTNVENLLDLDYDDSLFGDDTSSTSQSTTSNPNNNSNISNDLVNFYKPDNNVATMEQHLTDETNLYNYVNKVKAFESKVLESEGVDQNQIKNDTKIAEKQGDLDSKSSQRRNELFNDILELRREINQWSEGNEELKQAIERGKQINRSLQQQLNEKSREISDLKNEKTKKDEGATKIFKNNNLNSKNLFRNKVKELVIEQKPKLENYLTEQKQSDSPNSKIRSEIQQIKLS
ncbi:1759_t:CDS:10 [Entrophospora sp. SA101]|nr:1759_t:CDS:10 [Entrophospora sp. SA101]